MCCFGGDNLWWQSALTGVRGLKNKDLGIIRGIQGRIWVEPQLNGERLFGFHVYIINLYPVGWMTGQTVPPTCLSAVFLPSSLATTHETCSQQPGPSWLHRRQPDSDLRQSEQPARLRRVALGSVLLQKNTRGCRSPGEAASRQQQIVGPDSR